jgi:hypothetical protein
MSERRTAALRFLVVAVAGYFSLATSAEPDWYVRAAYVDLVPPTARIEVTLDAEAVILLGTEVLAIHSSSGLVWTAQDGPVESDGYCADYHQRGMFCEEVPAGSGVFQYEISLASAQPDTLARVEVFAGGPPERLSTDFGVKIEVLP